MFSHAQRGNVIGNVRLVNDAVWRRV